MPTSPYLHKVFQKLLTFLVAGGAAFFVGLGFLYVMRELLAVPYLVAVPLSALIAATTHYEITRRFIFHRSAKTWLHEYITFMSVTIFVIALITLGVYVGVELLHINLYISRILVSAVIAVASFFIHERFTFNSKHS